MLSLPEDWDYTMKGLARICKDGIDSISGGIRELEAHRHDQPPCQNETSDDPGQNEIRQPAGTNIVNLPFHAGGFEDTIQDPPRGLYAFAAPIAFQRMPGLRPK